MDVYKQVTNRVRLMKINDDTKSLRTLQLRDLPIHWRCYFRSIFHFSHNFFFLLLFPFLFFHLSDVFFITMMRLVYIFFNEFFPLFFLMEFYGV